MATKDKEALHPVTVNEDPLRNSGRDMGLVKPPAVSVNPTSEQKSDGPVTRSVNNAVDVLTTNDQFTSPYNALDMDVGSGTFIELEKNQNIDDLVARVNKHVFQLNNHYSVPVIDEDGDELWDQVIEKKVLRNDDGTIRMTGDGHKAYEANERLLPRVINLRQYAAKVITKGQNLPDGEADIDGVLLIRVF